MNIQYNAFRLHNIKLVAIVLSVFFSFNLHASESQIQPFYKNSLQSILDHYQNQPLMVVFWSTECSACLKELELISEFIVSNPDLNVAFVATDTAVDFQEIAEAMAKRGLPTDNSWAFADTDSQALRYSIDPKWYGEIPRTYFYDVNHQRIGLSGAIRYEQLTEWSAYTQNTDKITQPDQEIVRKQQTQ